MSTWKWAGDQTVLVEFDDADLAAANESARAMYRALRAMSHADIVDVVPAARSVMLILQPGADLADDLRGLVERGPTSAPQQDGRHTIEIGVSYGGDAGPDLAEVAALCDLTEAQVIERHAGAEYVVGFVGFTPGFAYLMGLPPELATPRLPTPRMKVPPGSVGIGGGFTGVYPRPTPGGWHLIGRTDLTLFDPDRDPPSRLAPGDRVRFVPAS